MTHPIKEEHRVKTPGQIAMESYYLTARCDGCWEDQIYKNGWEAAAAAVLAAQWRPVSEPPEDEETVVIMSGGTFSAETGMFCTRGSGYTHWMLIPPLPTPPEPTPQERERAEFEAVISGRFCGSTCARDGRGDYVEAFTHAAWMGWQAARKPKEDAR